MAWLDKRGQSYRVVFQFAGQTFKRSLGTRDRREAAGQVATVERRIAMVERGELTIPEEIDLPLFLLGNDQIKLPVISSKKVMSISEAITEYLDSIPAGSLESNSLCTVRIHLRHAERLLGKTFSIRSLGFANLQRYVDVRSREKGTRGKKINAVTIRKELASLSGLWSWMRRSGYCQVEFPNRGLRFPKTAEKPRFQTWAEIERQITRGRLSECEQAELWSCLYLTTSEIEGVLDFVEKRPYPLWFFPMLLMAAHTGARRSELVRSEVNDFDFESGTVLIREKKRAKGKSTSRVVPLSGRLRVVMEAWLQNSANRRTFHAGGFPLTLQDVSEGFRAAVTGTKWDKLKGWHVFRHSFISNCASRGVDQRMIDVWVGHTTEDMRRRYRHLLPDVQQAALASVFG